MGLPINVSPAFVTDGLVLEDELAIFPFRGEKQHEFAEKADQRGK